MALIRPTAPALIPATHDARAPSGGLPWERGFGGGATAAYDPSSESGYTLDLWAESGVTEAGTGVSSWVDGAGAVAFAQGTDANRPTYIASEATLGGKPCVHFDAPSLDLLTTGSLSAPSSEWTLYLFGDFLTSGATDVQQWLLDTQTGRLAWLFATTNALGGFYDGAYQRAAGLSTGAHSWVWVTDASAGAVYEDGSLVGSTVPVTTRAIGGTVGVGAAYNGAAGTGSDVKIGRLLLFAGQHDADTRARVEAWGIAHYGIV